MKIKHFIISSMIWLAILLLGVCENISAQSLQQAEKATSKYLSQTSTDLQVSELALSIGNRIEQEKLFAKTDSETSSFETTDSNQLEAAYRKQLYNSFFRLNALDYSTLLKDYISLIDKNSSKNDSREIYILLEEFTKSPDLVEKFPEISKILEPLTESKNWFTAASAWHFLSYISIVEGDINSSLQSTNNALLLVPEKISPEVTEMRIELTESLSYIHGRLRNPSLTVTNIARLIDLQTSNGKDVDGIMHLNNLIFVFSHWRDHETSQKLAKILIRNESPARTDIPGLSHMRLAQTMSEQSNFEETLALSNKGLAIVQNDTVKMGLLALRITGMAGLGRIEEAKLELSQFHEKFDETNTISDTLASYLIYTDALIAFGEGDIQLGQKLMTQRMDKYIQSTLRLSSKSTSELIATLENSKSRQIERQNALRREAKLREAELKQKTFTNYLLIVLSAILSIAAILSGLFARYRSRSATRLRIARDQAKAGEKAKTEFLAIMSHELRTPLNGIIGIADLLATTAPTESLRRKNNIILESGNDLLGLVESILDMSRIEAGEMGVDHDYVDIRKMLDSLDALWRPAITKADVVFTTFVDDSVPDLFKTDEKRMRQCLNNLISNAAKFTKSGRIHIHVTATPADIRGEMILSLIVADTGTGIREEVLERLFQPFVQADASITRNYGGAGLGLAITRSLARMLGGDVHVVSREGRGSEFTLTFQGAYSQVQKETVKTDNPQSGASPADTDTDIDTDADSDSGAIDSLADDNVMPLTPVIPAPMAPIENGLFSGLRILIVEDVISNQDIIQIFLRPLGCQFVTANNGIEALRALEIYEFDLILMDIRMPEMDGIEATRRIRAHEKAFRDIPIVALTADKTEETQTLCKAAGIDLFLTKPVISKDLISAVRFVIEHPPRQMTARLAGQQSSSLH